jgi:hypothetical protein
MSSSARSHSTYVPTSRPALLSSVTKPRGSYGFAPDSYGLDGSLNAPRALDSPEREARLKALREDDEFVLVRVEPSPPIVLSSDAGARPFVPPPLVRTNASPYDPDERHAVP